MDRDGSHHGQHFTLPSTAEAALIRAAARELRCTICFEALNDPVSLQCCHIFCRPCITHSIEHVSPQCPLCNGRADLRTVVSVPLVRVLVDAACAAAERCGITDIMETQVPKRLEVLQGNNTDAATRSSPAPGKLEEEGLQDGGKDNDDDDDGNVICHFEALTQGMQLAKTRQDGRSHTPPPPPAQQSAVPASFETQLIESGGWPLGHLGSPKELSSPRKRQRQFCDDSSHSSSDGSETGSQGSRDEGRCFIDEPRQGKCALCRLDTSVPSQMESFLNFVVAKDATCRAGQLQALAAAYRGGRCPASIMGELCGPFVLKSTAMAERQQLEYHPPRSRKKGDPAPQFAHYLCLLWSPDVFVRSGRLVGASDALRRGRGIPCAFCGGKGATLGCVDGRCRRSFHIPCAHLTGPGVCTLDEASFELHCPMHTPQIVLQQQQQQQGKKPSTGSGKRSRPHSST